MKLNSTLRAAVVALVSLGGMASCEPRLLPIVLQFDREFPFTIDSQTGLIAISTLTRDDVLGELDIPENAEVTGVEIQSARLELFPQAENTTSTAEIQLSYGTGLAPLTSLSGTILVNMAQIISDPINQLVTNAVNAARADIEAMIKGSAGAPQSITVGAAVASRSPGGSRFLANGTVRIKLTVNYTSCEEIPVLAGVGPDLPECTLDEG